MVQLCSDNDSSFSVLNRSLFVDDNDAYKHGIAFSLKMFSFVVFRKAIVGAWFYGEGKKAKLKYLNIKHTLLLFCLRKNFPSILTES